MIEATKSQKEDDMNLNEINQMCDEDGGTTSVSSADGQRGPDGAGPSQRATFPISFLNHCFVNFCACSWLNKND